jgi:large subunit ribosomal protein L3
VVILMSAIVGKKLGMTRVFDEDGTAIPVTVVEAQPNRISAIRRADRDGYDAVQLAGNPVTEKRLSKGELGHLKKAGAQAMADLVEFRDVEFKGPSAGDEGQGPKEVEPPAGADAEKAAAGEGGGAEDGSSDAGGSGEDASPDGEAVKVGDEITVASFQPGEAVKVSAVSVGKGFQGTVRRHGFSRGPVTHGSHNVRAPGSIGASADPARVFKGVGMPGRMGARRATQVGAQVVEIDAERNLLLIRGSVPGSRNATVEVRSVG